MRLMTNYLLIPILTRLSLIVMLSGSLFWLPANATQPSQLHQTQDKLKELDVQINHIQQNISSANGKRNLLNKQLSHIETQIGQSIQQLQLIERKRKNKEITVTGLQAKIQGLNQQLQQQQQQLGNHIRARYQMGEYQPLKWLLDQEDPYRINRLLTYYQYFIKSRQNLIDQITQTKENLNHIHQQLSSELTRTHDLEIELSHQQQQLTKNRQSQTILINTLNHEIQNEQTSLKEAKRNKINLAKLLGRLSEQSVIQASTSFLQMRKKLPFPVHVNRASLRKMNQGVTFFADEGAIVTAVHPGKVVFSDWLKGYGLLLIIDHGQGYMTLYAHNQSLFKKKGEQVKGNEQVACVGHSGGIKQNGLYFEIRQKGKTISPLEWLS